MEREEVIDTIAGIFYSEKGLRADLILLSSRGGKKRRTTLIKSSPTPFLAA